MNGHGLLVFIGWIINAPVSKLAPVSSLDGHGSGGFRPCPSQPASASFDMAGDGSHANFPRLQVRGFAPYIGYSYEVNRTNIPINEYTNHGAVLGISRNF